MGFLVFVIWQTVTLGLLSHRDLYTTVSAYISWERNWIHVFVKAMERRSTSTGWTEKDGTLTALRMTLTSNLPSKVMLTIDWEIAVVIMQCRQTFRSVFRSASETETLNCHCFHAIRMFLQRLPQLCNHETTLKYWAPSLLHLKWQVSLRLNHSTLSKPQRNYRLTFDHFRNSPNEVLAATSFLTRQFQKYPETCAPGLRKPRLD